jgi:hypothetical protein
MSVVLRSRDPAVVALYVLQNIVGLLRKPE